MAVKNTNLGGTDWNQTGLLYTDLNDTFNAMVDYVDNKKLSLISTITPSEAAVTKDLSDSAGTDSSSWSAQTLPLGTKLVVYNWSINGNVVKRAAGRTSPDEYIRVYISSLSGTGFSSVGGSSPTTGSDTYTTVSGVKTYDIITTETEVTPSAAVTLVKVGTNISTSGSVTVNIGSIDCYG